MSAITLQPSNATIALPGSPPPMMLSLFTSVANTKPVCTKCGHDSSLDLQQDTIMKAQAQIEDLQTQVRLLTEKATAAVDKWADYEDEIRALRSQFTNTQSTAAITPPIEITSPQTNTLLPSPSTASMTHRLSSFLSTRKSSPNFKLSTLPLPSLLSAPAHTRSPSTPTPPTPSELELQKAIEREQALREQETLLREKEQKLRVVAEGKLDEASGELEDLTVTLFQQANEMVAEERKARAKLEERVAMLERRDGEKRLRLERLEGAVGRIERVRGLLAKGNL